MFTYINTKAAQYSYICKRKIIYICNMKKIPLSLIENWYANHSEKALSGRRIPYDTIAPLLNAMDNTLFSIKQAGSSEKNTPIYSVQIGNGPRKILLWSQMHGNESTGTKAMFDLFKFLDHPENLAHIKAAVLNKCSLVFVPILNPDGADAFTRVNANGIDLNRDAVALVAKESKLLRNLLDTFNPEFCFNLHDQRTIFNVEGTKNPAAVSFLAPSEDSNRTLTKGRTETMSVISSMNAFLSELIPNHIGRYTDEFYPTATGDNFQKMGHNTILIEAGHYYDDYDRELVRKFNFYAILQGLYFLSETNNFSNYAPYFGIPNNASDCFDIICRNVLTEEGAVLDIAFQYDYIVKNKQVHLEKKEAARGDLSANIGHKELDLKKQPLKNTLF